MSTLFLYPVGSSLHHRFCLKISLFPIGIIVEFGQPLIRYDNSSATLRRNFGKQMRKDIMVRFRNVVSKLALLYDSKCWTSGEADGQHVEAAQMKFLGPLVGVTRRDHFRNENIRHQFGVGGMIQKLRRTVRD